MKIALVFLTLVAVGYSVPQPRKLFHEHYEDFLELLMDEAIDEIEHLTSHYMEFEEFQATVAYLNTANFKQLVYEMESLPEFKAVLEFLEKDNIDIMYFIDNVNGMLEQFNTPDKTTRHEVSGRDFDSYINDIVAVFPQKKLAALFEQKKAEDEQFRVAIENLESQEWQDVWNGLLANEVFQKEIQTLESNGILFDSWMKQLLAVFGQ